MTNTRKSQYKHTTIIQLRSALNRVNSYRMKLGREHFLYEMSTPNTRKHKQYRLVTSRINVTDWLEVKQLYMYLLGSLHTYELIENSPRKL
jgi:hypothetical protein